MSNSFRAFRSGLISPAGSESSVNLRQLDVLGAFEFTDRYIKFGYGTKRTIFKTRKGYLGSGPVVCEAGDVVCISEGATVPFLLRSWDQGDGGIQPKIWRLVGEGHLHTCIVEGSLKDRWNILPKEMRMEDVSIR